MTDGLARIAAPQVPQASGANSCGDRAIASATCGTARRSIRAPARASRSTAPSNAAATAGASASSATVSHTRNRVPASVAPRRSTARAPVSNDSASAASSTVRASGPTVSKDGHSGTTPSSDSSPGVVFSPTRLFQADGVRTDPPVSDPMASGAIRCATAAADPDDDPPDTAPGSLTQGGDAVTGFAPRPENASSVMCVLPRQTDPCSVAVTSTAASRSGTRSRNRADPASVAVPAVSNRSFQATGTPSSGCRRSPALARAAAASASVRARVSVIRA